MASLNKVHLIGNLTRDPDVRYTPRGTALCDLGLAVNRKKKDPAGNYQDEVTFLDVTIWGKTAENAGQYLAKGRPVYVEGRLHLDQWTDKSTGQTRQRLKVVGEVVQFLGGGQRDDRPAPAQQSHSQPPNQNPAPEDLPDDEIPF